MDMLHAVTKMPDFLSWTISQFYYSYMETLAVVGLCYIMWKMYNFLYFCYTLIQLHFIPWLLNNSKHVQKYGKWAIVTGATAGIGKAYAEELARHGMNIILVSRSKEKLQEVSNSITTTYGVKSHFIVADFSSGREVYASIKEAVKDLDIGILVNNAGLFYGFPERFAKVPEDKVWEIINVNMAASVMIVHIVLPGMVQRKRGAIINVISATCCQPVPLMTLYAASKLSLSYLMPEWLWITMTNFICNTFRKEHHLKPLAL